MSHQPLPIIVYAGPSLPPNFDDQGRFAVLRPPVAQGDIIKAVLQFGPCALAIIDGVFHSQPAVRHKEILWAVSKGVHVFGAASMGALRAAELAGYGMLGFGLIYRWYRRYRLTPDDAVALVHAPAALGFNQLSESLIDLRMIFKAARKAGAITANSERILIETASAMSYRDRCLSAIVERAGKGGLELEMDALSRFAVSQKRRDALGLLDHLVHLQQANSWPKAGGDLSFVVTDAFLADAEAAGIKLDRL